MEDELGAHGLAGAGFAGNDDALRLVLLRQPAVHSVDAGRRVSRGGRGVGATQTKLKGEAAQAKEEEEEEPFGEGIDVRRRRGLARTSRELVQLDVLLTAAKAPKSAFRPIGERHKLKIII